MATSSKLHDYSFVECAKDFCVVFKGSDAFMSQLSPTIAAENVEIQMNSTNGSRKTYNCVSLSYLMASSILTCEQANPKQTLVVDFSTSQITRF